MSKVLITKDLLDDLADAIGSKTSESTPMTIDDMTDAVEAITLRSGTDLTASGATVTVPAGLYSAQATKSVATGSEGTPTATKGAVSNHSVSVTPSVTNTTGYITGGTKTGTAVTVTASELVSGAKSISSNGTDIDVTNYATVDVSVPTGTARTSSDLTVSGATVTAPAGLYASDASASVASMTLPTSTSSSATSGYTSKATIGRSTSDQYINIPTGYNSAGAYYKVSAVANGSVTSPTSISGTSATVSTGTNTLTLTKTVSVTPNVTTAGYISTGTAGNASVSLTASVNTRSSSDLTVSGDTVTAPAGYYGSSASKSVTAGSAGTPTATKGTVSNHSVSVTPSVTNTTGYITGGTKTGTAVTVTASELASGNKEITSNGTNIDVVGYSTVSVDVQGGSNPVKVGTASGTFTQNNIIGFTNLLGEPTSLMVISHNQISTSSTKTIAAIVFDGSGNHTQTITNTSNAQVSYVDSGCYYNYDNNVIQITAQSGTGVFQAGQYDLIYTYGGSASCICTEDVQVGSGATSITFTNLEDEPLAWYLIFKSNFSTSSGYQRVIAVANDGTDTYGLEMDSAAHYSDAHWSSNYSNGSLTISSRGTNAGGYFHQPGYYELVYIIDADGNYQSKTVTPTEQTQIVQADVGYDALKKVTVNPIPSQYIVPSGNKTISANGTNIDVAEYSTVSVAVPFSTITVSSSNPTGGSNGDVWIKTS